MLNAPFARRGFPFWTDQLHWDGSFYSRLPQFPIRQDRVEYWDGSSKKWAANRLAGSLTAYCSAYWAPAPSREGWAIVGPNTDFPLGLTHDQASWFYWNWRRARLTASVSGSYGRAAYTNPGAVTPNVPAVSVSFDIDFDSQASATRAAQDYRQLLYYNGSGGGNNSRQRITSANVARLVVPQCDCSLSTGYGSATLGGVNNKNAYLMLEINPCPRYFFDGKFWLLCRQNYADAAAGEFNYTASMTLSSGETFYYKNVRVSSFWAGSSRGTLPTQDLQSAADLFDCQIDQPFLKLKFPDSFGTGKATATALARKCTTQTDLAPNLSSDENALPSPYFNTNWGEGVTMEITTTYAMPG